MSNELNEIASKALRLSPSERALLANSLLSSLDGKDDPDLEVIWSKEAEARYDSYLRGDISSKPATEVISKIKASLKNGN
jgi:hypothetical protein